MYDSAYSRVLFCRLPRIIIVKLKSLMPTGGLTDKEKRMTLPGSGTSFQKETTKENMEKSKINYLPPITKSLEYPVCETYFEFLVDTMKVLKLP